MIKLKNILFILTVLFIASLCYADKNFISVNSAGGKASSSSSLNTISVGQTVISSEETKNTIFRAGFLSALKASQSPAITFTNNTEQKIFETNVVPVKVEIKTTIGKITKLLYSIAEGENGKFGDYIKADFSEAATVNFEKDITFNSFQAQHRIKFYAQYTNGDEYDSKESLEFEVWTQAISSDTFKIISPDATMGTAAADPLIETTAIPIDLVSSVTVSLENLSRSVTVSTQVLVDNHLMNTQDCKLKCTYSDLVKIAEGLPSSLSVNAEYVLKISLTGKDVEVSDSVKFKVIGTGVADIYVYPSPFKPKQQNTTIQFLLAYDSSVTINLYDKAGKIVCQLIKDENCRAGINKVEWNGKNYAGQTLAVGAYICEVIAKSTTGHGEHRRYTALAIGK